MLVTTHYMDEAERCHRLAFIFRGSVLDVGTPDEIVARRHLRVAELERRRSRRRGGGAARRPEVDEVAHYGELHPGHGPGGRGAHGRGPRGARPRAGWRLGCCRSRGSTVEDAFVSMVRQDQGRGGARASGAWRVSGRALVIAGRSCSSSGATGSRWR